MKSGMSGATIGSGVLVAWGWNSVFPEASMPVEVAAILGAVLAPVFDVVTAARDAAIAKLSAPALDPEPRVATRVDEGS